jgi:hypothetical protein
MVALQWQFQRPAAVMHMMIKLELLTQPQSPSWSNLNSSKMLSLPVLTLLSLRARHCQCIGMQSLQCHGIQLKFQLEVQVGTIFDCKFFLPAPHVMNQYAPLMLQ